MSTTSIKSSCIIFCLSFLLTASAQKKINQQFKVYCDSLLELKKLNKIDLHLTKKVFSCGGKFHGKYMSLKSSNLFKIGIYDCNTGGNIDSGKWSINPTAQLVLLSKKQSTAYEFVSYNKFIFLVPITAKYKFIHDFSMARHGIDKNGTGFKIGTDISKNDFIGYTIRLEYFSYESK